MTAGVVRASRSVHARTRRAPSRRGARRRGRIIACCGQMVIAGGLERMTFEVLNVVRRSGVASHAIVNGWENFRITPLAEASRRELVGRALLVPADAAAAHAAGRRAGWRSRCVRVSANLLRVSRRIRPTHVFLPDFQTVLRNAPALLWLRARGVRVDRASRQRAGARAVLPAALASRRSTGSSIASSPTPSSRAASCWRSASAPDKVETIPNMPARRGDAVERRRRRASPGRVIFVGQIIPEKGLDLLLDAIALLRARGIDATLDVVGDMDGWEAPGYRGHRAALRERARAARSRRRRELSRLARGRARAAEPRQRTLLSEPPRAARGVRQRRARGEDVGPAVGGDAERRSAGAGRARRRRLGLPETTAEALAEGLELLSDAARRARAARAAPRWHRPSSYSEERFAAAWTRVFTRTRRNETPCGSLTSI